VSLPAVEKGWNFQEVYTSRKKPLTRDVRKLVVWNPLGPEFKSTAQKIT
jgi:hypothetical protein